MAYLGNPVLGPRIVPAGKARTSVDKLPSGRPGFRVTQGFHSGHDAIDLGNFNSGDHVRAALGGKLINRKDSAGALIVEITHSDGSVTGYAHLSRFARAPGTVPAGAIVGYVGDTGLGELAHLHFSLKVGGRNVDPWPRLVQNRPARLVGAGINIRKAPSLAADIYATSTATAYRDAYTSGWDWVRGGYHGIGAHPYDWRKLWIGGAYRYVARALVTVL
jgi:murein DD-endopeptidase MepM/ murein hydrolase activator NlpD